MNEFNNQAFLEWLEEQDGPIEGNTLAEEWPNFPIDELGGSTGPIVNGEFCYYQHDLRTIAEGKPILD